MDVLGSSSYSGSYYPQAPAAYDLYGHGYGTSETSSSSGYYPIQPGASYGSDFAAGIFGWAPSQPYHQSLDTSQSQDPSQESGMSYDPSRIPPRTSTADYDAAWQGFTDLPTEYMNEPDIYLHRHSTRF